MGYLGPDTVTKKGRNQKIAIPPPLPPFKNISHPLFLLAHSLSPAILSTDPFQCVPETSISFALLQVNPCTACATGFHAIVTPRLVAPG